MFLEGAGDFEFLRNPICQTKQFTKLKNPMDIQIIFELNLRKEKWLLASVYKSPAQSKTYFLNWLSQIIDFYSITYEK